MIVAVSWAGLLIVIYSYFIADKERKFHELEESFNYMRILKPDNKIGARTDSIMEVRPAPEQVKPNFSKIEIVHTMDKEMDSKEDKKKT
jgi:hypothetical protein